MSQKEPVNQANRFVIHEHTRGKDIHWDLMLQVGNTLKTYRLDKSPHQLLHASSNATEIFDHQIKFLTYEGSVNQGKGNVCIVENGTYEIINEDPEHISLNLNGKILISRYILKHIEDDNWILTKDVQLR
ncbi:MAG: DNA polymerase ligase N-terminal domain-containing protein [Planctomycetota bacterium]|jgi:hypothetical protein